MNPYTCSQGIAAERRMAPTDTIDGLVIATTTVRLDVTGTREDRGAAFREKFGTDAWELVDAFDSYPTHSMFDLWFSMDCTGMEPEHAAELVVDELPNLGVMWVLDTDGGEIATVIR